MWTLLSIKVKQTNQQSARSYLTYPAFLSGTWLNLEHIWRINTNVQAQNKSNTHCFHLKETIFQNWYSFSPLWLTQFTCFQPKTSFACFNWDIGTFTLSHTIDFYVYGHKTQLTNEYQCMMVKVSSIIVSAVLPLTAYARPTVNNEYWIMHVKGDLTLSFMRHVPDDLLVPRIFSIWRLSMRAMGRYQSDISAVSLLASS